MSGHPYVRAGSAVVFALAGLASSMAATASLAPDAVQPSGGAPLVCLAVDGVLHAPGRAGTCAADQRAILLASPATAACTSDPWSGINDCDPSPPAGDDVLDQLEARARKLEQRPLFEVVDRNGSPILQVSDGKAVVKNAAGDPVITLHAREAGGDLVATNLLGDQVALGVSNAVGGLIITEGGVKRVEFGRQPAGNVSLRFPRGDGLAAGIGESQGISGAIAVGDLSGRPRALMSVADDKGRVMIQNAKGAPVIALTEGASHGGLLVIGDATSEPMVKFGVNEDRYGVVLAGPVSGLPLVPNSGMAGSYFLGCAGGDKCGPGGGGSQ